MNSRSLSVVLPRVSRFYNAVIYLNEETIFQVSIDCETKSVFVVQDIHIFLKKIIIIFIYSFFAISSQGRWGEIHWY